MDFESRDMKLNEPQATNLRLLELFSADHKKIFSAFNIFFPYYFFEKGIIGSELCVENS